MKESDFNPTEELDNLLIQFPQQKTLFENPDPQEHGSAFTNFTAYIGHHIPYKKAVALIQEIITRYPQVTKKYREGLLQSSQNESAFFSVLPPDWPIWDTPELKPIAIKLNLFSNRPFEK